MTVLGHKCDDKLILTQDNFILQYVRMKKVEL